MRQLSLALLVGLISAASGVSVKHTYAAAPGPSKVPPASIFASEYVADVKARGEVVFYSGCLLRGGGRASLVIPLGRHSGQFFEEDAEEVVNTATVTLSRDGWRADVDQGGAYTIKRVNNVVDELFGRGFDLVLPADLQSVLHSTKRKQCRENLPQ